MVLHFGTCEACEQASMPPGAPKLLAKPPPAAPEAGRIVELRMTAVIWNRETQV